MMLNMTSGQSGKLVLIIGPSGVGKSVILKELRARHPEFHFPRSATTRPRREGEGDDLYRFVTDEEFDKYVSDGDVLEWAVVHGGPPGPNGSFRAGARYGTLAEEIVPYIEEGKTVVREVDVQGFDSISNHQLFRGDDSRCKLQSIFILPESEDQLVERITKRAPIDEDELGRRKASIEKELTYADLCDAKVKNVDGELEGTVLEVEGIITG